MHARTRAWLGWALVLGGIIAIAYLTLTPGRGPQPISRTFLVGPTGATDIIYNVVLFLPFGAGLWLAGWSTSRIVLVAAMLSGAIEFCQWHWIPTRFSSLADIISNTTGAGTGAVLCRRLPRLARPTQRLARAGALSFATGWVLATAAASFLLRLELPRTPVWWGQWGHTFTTTVPLPGRILSLQANNLVAPDGQLADTRLLQQRAASAGIILKVAATGMTSVAGRAQVAAIADGRGNLVAAIEQEHCTFRLVDQRKGERIGLRMLALNLPGECKRASDTIAIVAHSTHGMMALTVEAASGLTADTLLVTPASGWRLLAPSPRRVAHPTLLGFIWIALFMTPLAWFTRTAATQPAGLLIAGLWLFGATTMIAAAWITGLSFPSSTELAALGAAAAVGCWAAGRSRSGEDRLPDSPSRSTD